MKTEAARLLSARRRRVPPVGGGGRRRGLVVVLAIALASALLPGVASATITRTFVEFGSAPGGTPIAHGELVRFQYADVGVIFPDGVVNVRCDAAEDPCDAAQGGEFAAIGRFRTEFQNAPIEMAFDQLAQDVTFWIKPTPTSRAGGGPRALQAIAFDEFGRWVDAFQHGPLDDSWQQFSLSTPPELAPGAIARVEITGGQHDEDGELDNRILIDTIVVTTDDSSPPTGGGSHPMGVNIFAPSDGHVFETQPLAVEVDVRDDDGLATVDVQATHPDGTISPAFGGGNVCGATDPCADVGTPVIGCEDGSCYFFGSVQVTVDDPGDYLIEVRGCDRFGECGTDQVSVAYRPVPPADVRLIALELNQGVQGFPDVAAQRPGRTDPEPYVSSVPMVPGKHTLARLYYGLAAEGRISIPDRIDVEVTRTDGTSTTRTLDRLGAAPVPPPVDPNGSDWAAVTRQLRPDLANTANYVIPGELLEDATAIVVAGAFREQFDEPAYLGLNTVQLFDSMRDPVPTDRLEVETIPYLESALPVTDVEVLTEAPAFWGEPLASTPWCDIAAAMGLWWFGENRPREFPESNWWVPDFGYWDRENGGGCYFYKGFRGPHGGDVTTSMYGDTAAQEVGHAIGLDHAGNDHNEIRGGAEYIEPWPLPHGAMSPDGASVFGVLFEGLTPVLVDPCVDSTGAEDRTVTDPPCNAERNHRHDFMSYGGFDPTPEDDADGRLIGSGRTQSGSWSSIINYNRIHRQVTDGALDPPAGTFATSAAQAPDQATLISGTLHADGTVTFSMLLTKPVAAGSLDEPEPTDPDLRVRLLDADGDVLDERGAVLGFTHDDPDHFMLAVPYEADVVTVEAVVDEEVVGVTTAQGIAPAPGPIHSSVTEADGGVMTFEVEDDGGELVTVAHVSYDGGTTWLPAAYLPPGADLTAPLHLSGATDGADIRLRVLVTDGFSTGMATAPLGVAGPDCTTATPSTATLAPRGHEMRPITVEGVGAGDGGDPAITITGIRADEPADAIGDGSTGPDASGVGSDTAHVRAERSGTGDGRVYHLAFQASDEVGGSCTGTVQVSVPLSSGFGPAIDGGALYDATAT